MRTKIGEVAALYRYPVKSMRGEALEAAEVGWHGLEGDRRLALRRPGDRGGFPWLTASKLPALVLFTPVHGGPPGNGALPTHVRTPEGEELPVFGPELAADIARRHGSPVEMTHLDRGVFDETSISVITSATVAEVARLAAQPLDARRFRPNVVVAGRRPAPFEEDAWIGGTLRFGEGPDAPAVGISRRDDRCSMVNIDPDSAGLDPGVLKAIVKARANQAGVYGAVARPGRIAVGMPVFLAPGTDAPAADTRTA